MEYRDLSYKPAPVLLFDFDGLIALPRNKRVVKPFEKIQELLGKGLPLSYYYKINPKALVAMEELFYSMNVVLQVVAFKPDTLQEALEGFLQHLPINHIYTVDSVNGLSKILNSKRIVSYYYQDHQHYTLRHSPKCVRLMDWSEISV